MGAGTEQTAGRGYLCDESRIWSIPEKTTAAAADSPEAKKKALETAISQIEKNFGRGTIIKMGGDPQMNVSAISTGSLTLDLALGIGGIITPQTSSLLHNASTIALSMHSSRAYNL